MYVYVHVYVDLYVYVHVYVYVYLYVYVHVPKVAQEVPPVSLFCALQLQMRRPQGRAWPRCSINVVFGPWFGPKLRGREPRTLSENGPNMANIDAAPDNGSGRGIILIICYRILGVCAASILRCSERSGLTPRSP